MEPTASITSPDKPTASITGPDVLVLIAFVTGKKLIVLFKFKNDPYPV